MEKQYATVQIADRVFGHKFLSEVEDALNSMFKKGYKFISSFYAPYYVILIFEKVS